MSDQPSAPQMLQDEILRLINRYRQESDMTVCELMGVLKLVEIAVVVAHTRDR